MSVVAGTGRGQQRIIADSAADSFTVVRPWEVPLDGSSVIQVGGVNWRWKSGWFEYADDETENPRDVTVVFAPTPGPAAFDAQVYIDHSANPEVWQYGQDRDGVVTTAGDPRITFRMDTPRGYAFQRLSHHDETYAFGDRFVAVELAGVQGEDTVRIFTVAIDGTGPHP